MQEMRDVSFLGLRLSLWLPRFNLDRDSQRAEMWKFSWQRVRLLSNFETSSLFSLLSPQLSALPYALEIPNIIHTNGSMYIIYIDET